MVFQIQMTKQQDVLPISRDYMAAAEADLWLGSAASRKAIMQTPLEPYRFVHVACHGHLDTRNPALPALILPPARDDPGVLRLVDAMNPTATGDGHEMAFPLGARVLNGDVLTDLEHALEKA